MGPGQLTLILKKFTSLKPIQQYSQAQNCYNNTYQCIIAHHVTCKGLNLGIEDNNHSTQLSKITPIDSLILHKCSSWFHPWQAYVPHVFIPGKLVLLLHQLRSSLPVRKVSYMGSSIIFSYVEYGPVDCFVHLSFIILVSYFIQLLPYKF